MVSVTSSVDAAMSGRRCVFLCQSKSTLFGLPNVDAIRNHWLRFVYNRTANPNVRICATHFMDDRFVKHRRVQGWLCTNAISKKKKKRVNNDFALKIWCF